jgi:hypothetical protein
MALLKVVAAAAQGGATFIQELKKVIVKNPCIFGIEIRESQNSRKVLYRIHLELINTIFWI